MGYFSISRPEAWNIIREHVEIVHPYGSLGNIPVYQADSGLSFGSDTADISGIVPNIKTFTEAVDTNVQHTAQQFIASSEVLVFMGFGFLKQNMDLILPKRPSQVKKIHATTFGFSETDKNIISSNLLSFIDLNERVNVNTIYAGRDSHGVYVDVENTTCRSLIDNHRMRLMEG